MLNINDRESKYGRASVSLDAPRFNFDVQLLDLFCAYSLSENISIHRNSLIGLRELLNSIGEGQFDQNQPCIQRYRFCLKSLHHKLDENIGYRYLLEKSIVGQTGVLYEGLDPTKFDELDNDTVDWVESTISACLNILFINNDVKDLSSYCTEFINADYNDKSSAAKKIEDKVIKMHSKFRRNSVDKDDRDNSMYLDNISGMMDSIYMDISRPSYKLITGMQAFNGIIAGGFEGGSVYCLFGLPGEGKTVTLINLAYQIKKFNKNYVCKDKTKKPVILFLTMENRVAKVTETLFNIACTPTPFKDIPKSQANAMWESMMPVNEQDPISIMIKYKPINSVDTSYIYELMDNLEDEGYEVIAVIQDYIKRIRPEDRTKDMRIDLGNVINDFSNIAKTRNVPIITASQFNREGVRTVDEARNSNRHDLVNKLGRHMIGESGLIDENLDCSIFLAKEYVNGKKYMGFSCTKSRNRLYTDIVKFYQPFEDGNPIKYMTDEGLSKPVFKTSLIKEEENLKDAFGKTIHLNTRKQIKDIESLISESGMDNNISRSKTSDIEDAILGGTVFGSKQQIAYTKPVMMKNIFYRDCKPMKQVFHRIINV